MDLAFQSNQLQKILNALRKVRPSGNGWTALCPAHVDRRNSLSIAQGNDGRVLLKCHAGCLWFPPARVPCSCMRVAA